ncbi:hypothetical protein NX059_011758 [Plenodomus lindquistii]|nr:hypothetical protein NX059_011758 [Plenodomus lindquistii]
MGRGRVKRQAVESEDGWTVITHGLSGLSLGKGEKRDGKERENGVNGMPGTVDGLTAETLLVDFKKRQERWMDTECARHLQGLLEKRKWKVKEAVCIGIGSFSRDWEHRHRSMWQLVLFFDVVEQLRKQNLEVKLYAQEPAFTAIDVSFLKSLDIEVVESDVESHIDARAFVYSPFVDWYLLLPTFLQDRDPELYVGNEILDDYKTYAQTEDKKKKLEECNKLGQEFLKHRETVKLKEFDLHAHALNGMVVYWKKDLEDSNEDHKKTQDAPS